MAAPAPSADRASSERAPSTGRALVVYTLLRLGLFAGVFGLVAVLSRNVLLAAIVGALVSGVASYFLLAHQRQPLATAVERRVEAARQRSARRTAAEDEAAEQWHREQESARDAGPSGTR